MVDKETLILAIFSYHGNAREAIKTLIVLEDFKALMGIDEREDRQVYTGSCLFVV